MMLPTHALVGLAVALPLALGVDTGGDLVLAAGLVGAIIPDLDMYVGHRKTLHYPVYFTLAAVIAVFIAVVWWVPATAALVAFCLGAALHCLADAYGGGLELRPWEATSDRAVYDHYRGTWVAPRRWIRYDGAPEDFAVAVAIGVPLLVGLDGPFRWLVFACLGVATVYSAIRRTLPTFAERLLDTAIPTVLPAPVTSRLPSRYLNAPTERPHSDDRA